MVSAAVAADRLRHRAVFDLSGEDGKVSVYGAGIGLRAVPQYKPTQETGPPVRRVKRRFYPSHCKMQTKKRKPWLACVSLNCCDIM